MRSWRAASSIFRLSRYLRAHGPQEGIQPPAEPALVYTADTSYVARFFRQKEHHVSLLMTFMYPSLSRRALMALRAPEARLTGIWCLLGTDGQVWSRNAAEGLPASH